MKILIAEDDEFLLKSIRILIKKRRLWCSESYR